MKKYEQLETKIERLPSLIREDAIQVLNGDLRPLIYAFAWSETPQGDDYWRKIYEGLEPLTEDDILCLKEWIIASHQGEFDMVDRLQELLEAEGIGIRDVRVSG
jgi:hypothetical protein